MILNEINIGVNTKLGLNVYRVFNSFKPFLFVNNLDVSSDSYIEVYYKEYMKDLEGSIIQDSIKTKFYVVANIPAKTGLNELEEVIELIPAWSGFDLWYNSMARTPITATTGIIDSVEYTLGLLPIDAPTGYRLRSWAYYFFLLLYFWLLF